MALESRGLDGPKFWNRGPTEPQNLGPRRLATVKKNSIVNRDRLAPPNRGPQPTALAKIFSVADRGGPRPTESAFYWITFFQLLDNCIDIKIYYISFSPMLLNFNMGVP